MSTTSAIVSTSFPDAIEIVAADWRGRGRAIRWLSGRSTSCRKKFQNVDHYGPQQLAVFHFGGSPDASEMQARRAYELVQKLLSLL